MSAPSDPASPLASPLVPPRALSLSLLSLSLLPLFLLLLLSLVFVLLNVFVLIVLVELRFVAPSSPTVHLRAVALRASPLVALSPFARRC